MVRVGTPYKNKRELREVESAGDIGDSFLMPLFNKGLGEEFSVTFARVKENISNSISGAVIAPLDGVVFVSAAGNDANTGQRITEPKLTIAAAITAAAQQNPSQTNIVSIICNDGSTFTGNFSVPSFVSLDLPNATLTNTSGVVLTLADFSYANVGQIIPDGSSTIGIQKTAGTVGSRVICQNVQGLNGATCISHSGSSERFVLEASGIQGNGTLVSNTSTGSGRLIIRTDVLNLNGANAKGLLQNSSNNRTFITAGLIGHLESAQSGTIGIDCDSGTAIANVGRLDSETDIDIAAGAGVFVFDSIADGNIRIANTGILQARILQHTGTLTNNGTIIGTIGTTIYGAQRFETSLKFGASGQVVSSISNDTTLGSSSQNALVTEHAIKSYVDSQSGTFQAPAFTAFAVNIDESVIAGTSLTGSRTFTWTVTNAGNISGNLTIKQDGANLSTSVTPGAGTISLTINNVSLNTGQTTVFTIEGTDTQSNTFSRTYTITGRATDEFLYYGLSSSNNPASVATSSLSHRRLNAGTEQVSINIGPTSTGDYIIILTPDDEDITAIVNNAINVDVRSTFTRTEDVRTINSQNYNSYVLGPTNSGFTQNYTLTVT